MYTLSKDSIGVKHKNKGKKKRNKKVNSKNSIEESSYENIGLNSNSSNESFFSESSDTLNDDLLGLSKQCLTYPKNLIICHLNKNSVRNKFSSFQQTILSKTGIFLLSEIKTHFLILNFLQEASKRTVKTEPKTDEVFYSAKMKFYLVRSSILTNSRKILKQFYLNLAYHMQF